VEDADDADDADVYRPEIGGPQLPASVLLERIVAAIITQIHVYTKAGR